MLEEKASAALAAAVANEDFHRRAAEVKARAADSAKAKYADLVALAATGAEMDAASLMQAEDDARIATAEFEIASAIRRGAEKRKHDAEIAAWFDEAERLKNDVEQSLEKRFAAAAEVDALLAQLNRAIIGFNEAGHGFSNARIAASQFTADRDTRIARNPVLASMLAGTHPNAKNNYKAEIRQINAGIYDARGWLERETPIPSVEQREAFLWGRTLGEANSKS